MIKLHSLLKMLQYAKQLYCYTVNIISDFMTSTTTCKMLQNAFVILIYIAKICQLKLNHHICL